MAPAPPRPVRSRPGRSASCADHAATAILADTPESHAAGPGYPGEHRTAQRPLQVVPVRVDMADDWSWRCLRSRSPQTSGRVQQTTATAGCVEVDPFVKL